MARVCFTGRGLRASGEHYTRSQWEALAQQFGYEIDGDVDFTTAYLVAANPEGRSRKMQTARSLGIDVLSYAEFESMVLAGQQPTGNNRQTRRPALDDVLRERGVVIPTRSSLAQDLQRLEDYGRFSLESGRWETIPGTEPTMADMRWAQSVAASASPDMDDAMRAAAILKLGSRRPDMQPVADPEPPVHKPKRPLNLDD